MGETLYNQKNIAEAAGVSVATVCRAVREGLLPEPDFAKSYNRFWNEDNFKAAVEYFKSQPKWTRKK